jgi:hypothetical protein
MKIYYRIITCKLLFLIKEKNCMFCEGILIFWGLGWLFEACERKMWKVILLGSLSCMSGPPEATGNRLVKTMDIVWYYGLFFFFKKIFFNFKLIFFNVFFYNFNLLILKIKKYYLNTSILHSETDFNCTKYIMRN